MGWVGAVVGSHRWAWVSGLAPIGAELLLNFITKVYEKRSLIVTTNLPFSRWNEVFHDATAAAAVIDRIVHHSIILQTDGASYRLKAAKHQQRKERGH